MAETVERFLGAITVSELTRNRYRSTMTAYVTWKGMLPESATDAQAFLDSRVADGKKPSTTSVDQAALKRYLLYAEIPVTTFEVPAVLLQPPKYLSKSEIAAMMEAADSTLVRCIIALLYSTGARINEILNLHLDDIDEEGFLHVVRKYGRKDKANCTPWGMDHLTKWLEQREGTHPQVFGTWDYRAIKALLVRAAKKAGIEEFTPHMLRHSRARHLLEAGVRIEDIGYQLGHVNIETTRRIYTRPVPEDLKKVIPEVDI